MLVDDVDDGVGGGGIMDEMDFGLDITAVDTDACACCHSDRN